MIIDGRPDRATIRRWQQEYETMDPELSAAMQKCFAGDETDDFYLGLLAGLSACGCVYLEGAGASIIQLVAVAADMCDRKELA